MQSYFHWTALSARTWLLKTYRLQICLYTTVFGFFCRSMSYTTNPVLKLDLQKIWWLLNIIMHFKKILNCYTDTCKVTKHSSIYPYKYNDKELLSKPWCPSSVVAFSINGSKEHLLRWLLSKPKKIFDLKNKEFVDIIFLLLSPWWKL